MQKMQVVMREAAFESVGAIVVCCCWSAAVAGLLCCFWWCCWSAVLFLVVLLFLLLLLLVYQSAAWLLVLNRPDFGHSVFIHGLLVLVLGELLLASYHTLVTRNCIVISEV